jgi:hypothetical protein
MICLDMADDAELTSAGRKQRSREAGRHVSSGALPAQFKMAAAGTLAARSVVLIGPDGAWYAMS